MSQSGNAINSQNKRHVHLYGCGIVAPGAENLFEFVANVKNQNVTLSMDSNLNKMFMVGNPKFDFEKFRGWISERHNQSRFSQLQDKGGFNVQCAVGMAIQCLEGNPGLEAALKKADPKVMVCVGTGFGDVSASFRAHDEFTNALEDWNAFWSMPDNNTSVSVYLKNLESNPSKDRDLTIPVHPNTLPVDSKQRRQAWVIWNAFWSERSTRRAQFLSEFESIESRQVGAEVALDKLNAIRAKAKAKKLLIESYNCPTPPWEGVNANFLWNIPNVPASQIAMLLGVHGVSYASIGACATFGLVLRHALDAIEAGDVDFAIVGTVDIPPAAEVTAGFHAAKVLAAGGTVATPLCELRGTHVSGGGCLWVLGGADCATRYDVRSLGTQIISVGLSSDAEHIITPSLEGPKHCIRQAFDRAGIAGEHVHTWDMHATGTPGDASEFHLLKEFIPNSTLITARKGLFGHGMSTCGGWELTAQVFATSKTGQSYTIPACGIVPDQMHSSIVNLSREISTNHEVTIQAPNGLVCGKLNMGIGGISSCVLTKIL